MLHLPLNTRRENPESQSRAFYFSKPNPSPRQAGAGPAAEVGGSGFCSEPHESWHFMAKTCPGCRPDGRGGSWPLRRSQDCSGGRARRAHGALGRKTKGKGQRAPGRAKGLGLPRFQGPEHRMGAAPGQRWRGPGCIQAAIAKMKHVATTAVHRDGSWGFRFPARFAPGRMWLRPVFQEPCFAMKLCF